MVTERLSECTTKDYTCIHIISGGANSKMLCQMMANTTNKKVVACPAEATALGNVAAQLIASGQIKSIADARMAIKSSCEIEEYLPCDTNKWDDAYQRFCSIILERGE
jgi:rhamnulokinase/L-fuculokinase